jgi:hypothetical protein
MKIWMNQMAKINARAKGASGEREFCDWLQLKFNLDEKPTRNLDQVRDSGADVICHPFAFEVKRCEALSHLDWWGQVNRAVNNKSGKAFGLEPVVVFRQNGKRWNFMIDAKHIGVQGGWIILTELVFKKWADSFVEDYQRNKARIKELTNGNAPFLTIGVQ